MPNFDRQGFKAKLFIKPVLFMIRKYKKIKIYSVFTSREKAIPKQQL